MSTIRIVTVFSSVLILVACSFSPSDSQLSDDGTGLSTSSAVSSVSSSNPSLTHNVTYFGMVEELGPSIYMQGSHKLTLDDGRFILLDSSSPEVQLAEFIGERVEVTGATEPTVEAGGTIMHAETIVRVLSQSSLSSAMSSSQYAFCGGIAGLSCPVGYACIDDSSDSCDPLAGGADCIGICVPAAAQSSSSTATVSSAPVSSVRSSVASSVPVLSSSSSSSLSSSVSSTASTSSSQSSLAQGPNEATVAAMAKRNYADESKWSQEYCSAHIGFCLPVHKDWYYVSFGAKAGSLWHVEFSIQDFSEMGSGVISLDLRLGSSLTSAMRDGSVEVNGSNVIGYKDWGGNHHFEITADARLKTAVQYLIDHISSVADQ